MDKKDQNLYQVACLRLFENSHKNGMAENVGNHPNSFFTSALAFERATRKAEQNKERAQRNAADPAKVGDGSPGAANTDVQMADAEATK